MPNLIDPRYCCLAVPLVNAGIYGILTEQTAVAITIGVLSFVAPTVVGAASPTAVTYILGACAFVGVAIQPIGFFGVFREKTTTFRVYTALNAIMTAVTLIVGAVIIIISAVRHDTAMEKCRIAYFTPLPTAPAGSADTLAQQSGILCKAFAWADIGFMGGLWVLLFITQTYFVWAARGYGKAQVSDHKLYHSVYSENPEAFTMSILQSRRYNPDSVMFTNSMYGGPNVPPMPGHEDGAWNVRPSHDEPGPESGGGYYNHQRGYSDGRHGLHGDDYGQQHGTLPHDAYAFNTPGGGYVDGAQPPHHYNDGQHHVHYSSDSMGKPVVK